MGIGLIGFGTVLGDGVYTLIQEQGARAQHEVKRILVRDVARYQELYPEMDPKLFVSDLYQILEDPEITIVVEGIGGVNPAYEYVLAALEAGKHVVSANKDMLATHLPELFKVALENRAHLRFEPAVCGGMDLIAPLSDMARDAKVHHIRGILNGTTNYILTKMFQENLSFSVALKQAQESGFAEANADSDVKGFDSAYKLSLLAAVAMGDYLPVASITIQGIDRLTEQDTQRAKEAGQRLRLIADVRRLSNGELQASVAPVFMDQDSPFYAVDNELNLVQVETVSGSHLFGPAPGAGARPTGESILRDLAVISEIGMERGLLGIA